MKEILWLDEPGCEDATVTGGKAANLARLCAVHPVPSGFCLSAAAHDRWAGSVDGPFPEELTRVVAAAYATLAERSGVETPVVAVRSSAVDEDGADASFAGIYLTCLNVRGLDNVLRAIARCWASANDPRVAAYRRRQGLSGAGVGVLVQELVVADAAAVVFSSNPLTGAADEVVINANYGLGESVVGGMATPDTWVLRKPDLSQIRFQLGHKEQMTVLSADGTREVPVLRTLRGRPSLEGAQVCALGQLALRLEETMGWPVDIECAYKGEKLYLLQCRPVTTGKVGRAR
jgi:pyruvate, water dikinase